MPGNAFWIAIPEILPLIDMNASIFVFSTEKSMRSFFTRVSYALAQTNRLFNSTTARQAMDAAAAHAEADGMVDAVRGHMQPPFMLLGAPALCHAWRDGHHFARRLRDCMAMDTSLHRVQLQTDSGLFPAPERRTHDGNSSHLLEEQQTPSGT